MPLRKLALFLKFSKIRFAKLGKHIVLAAPRRVQNKQKKCAENLIILFYITRCISFNQRFLHNRGTALQSIACSITYDNGAKTETGKNSTSRVFFPKYDKKGTD